MPFQADTTGLRQDVADWSANSRQRLDFFAALVDAAATQTADADRIVKDSAVLALGAQQDMARVASFWSRLNAAWANLNI